MYAAIDFLAENQSMRDYATGYMLTKAAMEMFTDWYLPDESARSDPRASPQRARDHTGLPPASVQTAEYDMLRDEGRRYADTLTEAGVAVEYTCYAGMIHGFMRMGSKIDTAITALDDAVDALRKAFV